MEIQALVNRVKELYLELERPPTKIELMASGVTKYAIEKVGGVTVILQAAGLPTYHKNAPSRSVIIHLPDPPKPAPPKILLLDIETSYLVLRGWGTRDQNFALNQIQEDWSILAFCARFLGEEKTYYLDTRYEANVRDDSMLLVAVQHLLNQADIVIGHNVKEFDLKKINARMALLDMDPPTSYRIIDTLSIARRHFKMTSNKLEYLADKLGCTRKGGHKNFPGMDLWTQCLEKNMDAWAEMEEYNRLDVDVLEEVYFKLRKWDKSINFSVFSEENVCSCGSKEFLDAGFVISNTGKFARSLCGVCKKEHVSRINLLNTDVKKGLYR